LKRPLAVLCVPVLTGAFVAVVASSSLAAPPEPSVADRAAQAVSAHAADVRSAKEDAYHLQRSKVDPGGAQHVRYTRTYRGLRVYGGDFVVHTKADGSYGGVSVGLNRPLSLSTKASIKATAAAEAAKAAFTGTITETGRAELFIDASRGDGRLAYETVVRGWATDGQTPSVLHVITDAHTGALIGSFDEIESVHGTGDSLYAGTVAIDTTESGGLYSMIDPLRAGGSTCDMNNGTTTCVTFTDADNAWGTGANNDRQSAAVDAHFGAAKTFDYFLNVHGRNGIFGDGQGVPSRVHYGDGYANAFWDGLQMTYGDGLENARPLVSLDVAGHEMSHGVTEALVGLNYYGESGGLNEASSDIFGNMVEFYAAAASDPGDYEIGEKINIDGDGKPLRYMYNPSLDGHSHSCWSTTTQNLDVHYSSGVANHFYFNLAEGTGATPYGTSPVCGSAPPVTGIGRSKAEKIWYRALEIYFTSTTQYVNPVNPANTSRAHTLSATTDLFGQCSMEYRAVQAAWTSVNVAGNDPPCPDNDFYLTVSPNAGSVDAGSSVTSTITSTRTFGTVQTVDLTVQGLPAGADAVFSPASIGSDGGVSTMTIVTSSSTASGTYTVAITGTGPGAARVTTFALTVNALPGCSQTNGTDVVVPDKSTVESPITISGCAGTASSSSTVEVRIIHPRIWDLTVSLVAPDGTTYPLHNQWGVRDKDIHQTYTVNLFGKVANGTWRLRVRDVMDPDPGMIDSWTLDLGGSAPACTGTNDADVTIPDQVAVESSISLSGCAGTAGVRSMVAVRIAHPYTADIMVSLVAPDGTAYMLQQSIFSGGGTNLNQTYSVNLSGEAATGTWKLRVQDAKEYLSYQGTIDSWTLDLTGSEHPACAATADTDTAIGNLSTAESPITVSGCELGGTSATKASARSVVAVDIAHPSISDLVVSLIAPDGTAYPLHNRSGGGADLIRTYTVDLSGEYAGGTWKLRVQDTLDPHSGTIDSWTLDLTDSAPPPCAASNASDVPIPAKSTVTSVITLSGCSAKASELSTTGVRILHPSSGSIRITLVSPDGSTYVLHDYNGGSADDIDVIYPVNLFTEMRNGTWTLQVRNNSENAGIIDSWALTL
jgi:Zn-dependent metalloprotease/subtilisin-like proprotein convertase family protein